VPRVVGQLSRSLDGMSDGSGGGWSSRSCGWANQRMEGRRGCVVYKEPSFPPAVAERQVVYDKVEMGETTVSNPPAVLLLDSFEICTGQARMEA
jgi:hypothetical protein